MILGITQAVAAILSCLGCLFIFFVMIIFKKYVYPGQRLLIYLTLSVFLVSLSFIIRGFGYSLIDNTTFCVAVAFIGQYAGGCILASVASIIADIFILAVLKKNWKLEPAYVVSIFVMPALFDWLPFIYETYGPTRGWCWIRDRNADRDCSVHMYGLVLQYVLWFVPSYFVSLIGGLIYIISLVALRRKEYTAMLEPERLQLQKAAISEIQHYKWYPLMFLIINTIPLLTRIISDANPSINIFPLWLVSAAVQGLQGGFVTVLFSIDSDTRKRLKWSHFKNGFKYNIMNFEDTVEYPAITGKDDSDFTDSLRN